MPDNMTGTQELLFAVLAPLILLGVLIYATMRARRRSAASRLVADAATERVYREEERKEKAATGEVIGEPGIEPSSRPAGTASPSIAPDAAHQSRPQMTEDEMQQRALGGVKGSPNLEAAPLTDKERLNTFVDGRR
jgi:hypothetical protein